MRGLAAVTIAVTAIAAMLAGCAPFPLGGREVPDVKLTPPPGYEAITNQRFGFAVPRQWIDDGGDAGYLFEDPNDPAGSWLVYASSFTGCGKSEKLPKLVGYYAETDHYEVTASSSLGVSGASGAWRYDIVDAAGKRHTAVNVWVTSGHDDEGHCIGKEMWLVINVDEPQVGTTVANTVVNSLVAKKAPE